MTDGKKKPGRPAHKEVVCAWPNVWTSKGKLVRGEKVSLPAREAADLKNAGAIE